MAKAIPRQLECWKEEIRLKKRTATADRAPTNTVPGEPAMKMLRYQQQYSFFNGSKLGKAIRFINLTDVLIEQDLNAVLEEIIKQVTAVHPSIVVIDSFRTVVRRVVGGPGELEMQTFIQRLAQFLTSWQAT